MYRHTTMRTVAATCLLACWWTPMGQATELAELDWSNKIDDDALGDIRGGFDAPGLRVGVGLGRELYVNGVLVSSLSAFVPDIGGMTSEQASTLGALLQDTSVLQLGPNNQVAALAGLPGLAVIQNTLNDQQITALTTITADVNTLGLFQFINTQDSLQQALNRVASIR